MNNPQHFVLVAIRDNVLYKAIGVYKDEEDAYAAAIVCQMQSIEKRSEKWPKSTLLENQENIRELCRCIKDDLKSFKERVEYMALQSNRIFANLDFTQYQVLPVDLDKGVPSESVSESIFKTKVRNFMDVLRKRSDVEEDLGNSDDDDEEDDDEEDEEEEEEGEGEGEGDEEEEDIEDEEEDLEEEDIEEDLEEDVEEGEGQEDEEEEDEEDEGPGTSQTAAQDQSEDEELQDTERHSLKRDASSLLDDGEGEDDEEDEIDDEDELADDDDESAKRRRVVP